MKYQRIYYLNPPYADLSIEGELLEGSGFELVPVRVQGDIVGQIADAAAIMTNHVPISESIAAQLRRSSAA